MEFYIPRKLMFKAWNKESRLLTRLDNISCIRGQLTKKDHVILQYTGLKDKQQEELYEMDLVLIGSARYVIRWSDDRNGWAFSLTKANASSQELDRKSASTMIRLCSAFESSGEV